MSSSCFLDVYVGSSFDIVLTHPRSTPSLCIFDCIAGSLEREAFAGLPSATPAPTIF
jgi:hypothetical protein